MAVLACAIIEPHSLRFLIKHGLTQAAWLHGTQLAIGGVDGSIFEPLTFRDVRLSSRNAGVTSNVTINRAEARLAWRTLALQRGAGFFAKLTVDGFQGDVVFEPGEQEFAPAPWPIFASEQKRLRSVHWLPLPPFIEVWHASLSVRAGKAGDRAIFLSDTRFTLNEFALGDVAIGKLTVRRGWFHKTFANLRGTSALRDTRLTLADLQLQPGVWIKSISADFNAAAERGLQVAFDFASFGGSIHGELQHAPAGQQPNMEVAGTFSQISVADLAKFLEVRETAGGVIREGKFSFRGSPRTLDKATISTRFEATDFVWGNRRWNLLVLGATVVDRRLQIPELQLQQAHNALKLKGEFSLPENDAPWWESAFNFEVAGRINNLTELSALFGPHFNNTSGKMTIDGSVRGESKTFSGQLIVTGSKLTYRGAPIDLFNAAVKLEGNEFQMVNLEMVHGDDFLRGHGSISILGEKRYSGELRINVEDLASYAPLLEKPIAPAPLAGGLVLNWSGDGTFEAHSGAFTARLRKLHAIGSKDVFPALPIDAEVEGTYAPGGLSLGKCVLANDGTRLETRLSADKKSIKLDPLKLTRDNAVWLEGTAILPVNLFRWWTASGVEALVPDAPFKVGVTAKGVQLDDVARLTGRPIPVRGVLSGKFNTDGTLRNLKMTGSGKLTKGQIPANPLLPLLENVEADAELDGNVLRFSKFSARHAAGDFTGIGAVDFSRFESPALDVSVHGEKIEFTAGPAWKGKAKIDLTVAGTREHANVIGSAVVHSLDICPTPDFGPLISGRSVESINVPAPSFPLPPPLDGWRFDVAVSTAAPVGLPSPGVSHTTAEARLHVSGSGKALAGVGSFSYSQLPFKTEFSSGIVQKSSYYWGNAPGVKLAACVAGKVGKVAFTQYFAGSPANLATTALSDPEMSAEDLHTLIIKGFVPLPPNADDFRADLRIFPCFSEPFTKP